METVTSFHAADVPPDQLGAILADYWAQERRRDLRREFLPQLALLAVMLIIVRVFSLMSTLEFGAALAGVIAAAVWLIGRELHGDRRLVRHLEHVPGSVTRVVRSRAIDKKVIKSS